MWRIHVRTNVYNWINIHIEWGDVYQTEGIVGQPPLMDDKIIDVVVTRKV